MAKYRKKPVVVEAVRWFRAEGKSVGVHGPVPKWLADAIDLGPSQGGVMRIGDDVHVFTLEGVMIAQAGDWIIRGVEGELYPCKDSVFQTTYELVA